MRNVTMFGERARKGGQFAMVDEKGECKLLFRESERVEKEAFERVGCVSK